jgi:hypothetical protein
MTLTPNACADAKGSVHNNVATRPSKHHATGSFCQYCCTCPLRRELLKTKHVGLTLGGNLCHSCSRFGFSVCSSMSYMTCRPILEGFDQGRRRTFVSPTCPVLSSVCGTTCEDCIVQQVAHQLQSINRYMSHNRLAVHKLLRRVTTTQPLNTDGLRTCTCMWFLPAMISTSGKYASGCMDSCCFFMAQASYGAVVTCTP